MINSENVSVCMVGSRDINKAKRFSKEFNIENYGNYENVLNNHNVDAVYISLPIGLQIEWAIKAAKAGKHILCEKSAVTSFEAAKLLVNTARDNNVRILEAFMFRFHPQHKKFIQLMTQEVGDVFVFESKFGLYLENRNSFRFNKELGGSSLNDVGCYPVCASRIIFNSEPIGVMANLIFEDKNGIDVQGSSYLLYPAAGVQHPPVRASASS